jgi:hypothetical protein
MTTAGLHELTLSELGDIVNSESLSIESKDSFLDWIHKLGSASRSLLWSIRLEALRN